ncbi:hypothetical protein BS50DRAFT_479662 [Corynespora cassiicola Philippines]|uniref:Rhodopsin domain-containing protein n=1 Tax=Corynespora cassiicola Philippines TaxID=1448308 RepID=A0A2T2PAR5_CORCC|nr:hypothetical protein BS50DRAFT_479662 [Corynespora cassiicola Philippines]
MGDDTQSPILLGVGGGLLCISILLLCARLWSRMRPISRLRLDDWTALAATILAIAHYALLSASVVYGLGRHARFVSFSHRRMSLQLLFISQVVWFWSITLVKLSVAFLLLRIKQTRRWRIFVYSTMTILLLAAFAQTFFQFLQCRPFQVYWDPRLFRQGPVRCFKRSIINGNIVAFSSIQVGIDLIFSFIPIIFIRKLNRPRREKIFMCVLMGLGIFASIAAIVRTMTLQGFYTTRDIFRFNIIITLWAVLEQQFALIAATLPTLKAFMEQVLFKLGLFFYDEKTEAELRGTLVEFGLLNEGEKLEKVERRTVGEKELDFGISTSNRKVRDEWGDTFQDPDDKDIEGKLIESAKSSV